MHGVGVDVGTASDCLFTLLTFITINIPHRDLVPTVRLVSMPVIHYNTIYIYRALTHMGVLVGMTRTGAYAPRLSTIKIFLN